MNNLPNEVLRNIINYTGESAKNINSRFYEISLDCKWNYKLIDLSTITIEYLKELKNSNVEYIKIIVTKNRSKEKLIEVIKFLFNINKFKLKGVYIDVPLCFKSKEEIEFFKQFANDGYSFYYTYLEYSIVFQLEIGIYNQIFLNNLIFDLSEHTDSFDEFNEREIDNLRRFYSCFDHYFINNRESDNENLDWRDVKYTYKYHKINNFIYKNFSSHYNKYHKTLLVYNGKHAFIDMSMCSIVFGELPYKNMNNFLLDDDFEWLPITSDIDTPTLELSYNEMLERSFGTDDFNKILKIN